MPSSYKIRNFVVIPLLALVLIFAGCYASKFSLIPPDKAKVDKAYIGNWDLANATGEHVKMIVRNIDDKQLYIEIQEKDKTERYVGFTAPVGSATFAHVRPIQEDGEVPDGWILMRAQVADGKLTLRMLNEDFFKDKQINSSETLKSVVEKNVENDAMYAMKETITGTKLAK